jgi:hypothetical protein
MFFNEASECPRYVDQFLPAQKRANATANLKASDVLAGFVLWHTPQPQGHPPRINKSNRAKPLRCHLELQWKSDAFVPARGGLRGLVNSLAGKLVRPDPAAKVLKDYIVAALNPADGSGFV